MAATQEVQQLTAEQLAGMSPEDIVTAQTGGQLAAMLGAPVALELLDNDEQLTQDEYQRLTPAQIAAAYASGRLADILATPPGAAPSAPNAPGPLLKQGG